MPFRVLVVEDDKVIAESVVQGFREEGYTVVWAANGHEGDTQLSTSRWDAVILDWWLPGPDGMSLLRKLRAAKRTTPVLFLTAADAVPQRIEGLRAGADDYLCKPFVFDELLARVEALLRRAGGTGTELRYRDVMLDLSTSRAERAGRPLHLTAREQALLSFFLQHQGEVLSRAQLYEHVWQDQYDSMSNTLEVHVMELRRKLEAIGPRIIQTARGRGYVLSSSVPGTGIQGSGAAGKEA